MINLLIFYKGWHRRSGNGSGFPFKERMIALFVTAPIVRIMLIIVMQKACFSAHRARRIVPPTICPLRPRAFGCKLMMAFTALILLITVRILAVTIKWMIVVAFRTANVVWFHHENLVSFWEIIFLWWNYYTKRLARFSTFI